MVFRLPPNPSLISCSDPKKITPRRRRKELHIDCAVTEPGPQPLVARSYVRHSMMAMQRNDSDCLLTRILNRETQNKRQFRSIAPYAWRGR